MSAFESTKNKILKSGFVPETVESLAFQLSNLNNIKQAESTYIKFDSEADKLPWPRDHDFGALALQKFSFNATFEISKFMLAKAIERAERCASCATSGGEGLARSRHVKELQAAYQK
ncbi:hypothetical protein [Colwellia sp. E2M01]|uniref:hypothetical protein n=1 Tax=Colwellia sp. E2M01 TaxID=2841561 RepID=UPI001C07FB9D|nr:hypothetical protein [Colwellia sp. E2M01]MBU2872224.1 hypothetical protein [Colwellia sp. E2M01]